MPDNPTERTRTPWLAMRQSTGLSQREVERRLGWAKGVTGYGRLSLIERGIAPDPDEERDLRAFYAGALLGESA